MEAVGTVAQTPSPTLSEAMEAVRTLIRYIGDDPSRDGLVDTPRRVVKAWSEMTFGLRVEDPVGVLDRVFEDSCDQLVVLTGLRFVSLCEHHFLPFIGTATIGYIPSGGKIVGLSKIPRLLEVYASRPQVQERLTRQIAEAMESRLSPLGVGVVLKAQHECMSCRGVRQFGADCITNDLRGAIRDNAATRAEFMAMVS